MHPPPALPILALADCVVDTGQQTLTRADRVQHLTTLENEVLVYLWDNAGRTVTREELLEAVWGHPRFASTEPVYATIKRLRAKIEGPGPHRHVVTVHGEGYRFERPTVAPPPLPGTPPASRVTPAPPPPHAAARTRFIGRDADLAALEQRLAAGARLVTLVGPGGVGKTRLARELERRRAARGEVTLFVDLAAARTLDDALRALATALDVPLDAAAPRRGLVRALTARAHASAHASATAAPTLVVLDNVEQLVPLIAAEVALWADALPVVATSRERLDVSGEHALELEPLAQDAAVALFVDRATMASASFDAHAEREHVAAIVERLDRLPLAIELAAARVRLFAPKLLHDRLGDQLDGLGRAPRDLPLRHATLREAVEWSWQLLGDDERSALAAASIFAGGFTLEAAEAVIGGGGGGGSGGAGGGGGSGGAGGGGGAGDVEAVLERLCDRSLVRVHKDVARFELYAAVQQLAAERLAASSDAVPVARRHAAWAIEEASRWVADLDGKGHARAREHLERELDNVRAALERATSSEDVARLALLLDRGLRLRGGAALRRRVLEKAQASDLADADRAALSLALGECLAELGDPAASAWLELARAAAERGEGPELAAIAALAEAAGAELAASRGDLAAARAGFERAAERARTIGASRVEGRVATLAGEVLWRAGKASEARAALEQAQRSHLDTHDLRWLSRTHATLCHVLRAAGRPAQALIVLDEAERGFAALGDALGAARTLVDRGLHLSRVGRQREAIAALERARAAFDRLGVLRGHEEVQLNLAEALLGIGDDARALAEVHRAVAVCRELDERLRLSTALELLACAAMLRGDLAAAEGALDEALAMALASGNERSRATILAKRGLAHDLRGRAAEALADFEASAAINRARGEAAMEGTSLADVAVALAALGRHDEVAPTLDRARALLGEPRSSAPPGAATTTGARSTWVARMLALLEATCEVHAARARGDAPEAIRARATAVRDAVLARMPPDAQDLATRLSCVMLDHALALAPPSLPRAPPT